MSNFDIYLQPTSFIDCESPAVIEFAHSCAEDSTADVDRAVKLYYSVRDRILYDPYHVDLTPESLKASAVLARKRGFCIEKAILLAAGARALRIPSRLGFADVRNHLATDRLRALMKTDVFLFHGYTELLLEDKWVKATPAFNLSLCERFGVQPLEFDGRQDSIFHPVDVRGNRHMEYVRDRGQYADLPYQEIVDVLRSEYPGLFARIGDLQSGNFEEEAAAERARHP